MSEDFPPPDTPVILMNLLRGNFIFKFFKLFPLAPLSSIKLLLLLKSFFGCLFLNPLINIVP